MVKLFVSSRNKKVTMNHLNKEKSAYLREAINQPVHWYPWSEQAFIEAKKQCKSILLDIGASWCHWCHVIDHESYENKEIAEIINKNFIAVKVDRDERPDIDKIYQEIAVMISGQGGWPLTVFLTHDKIPFYTGTYFPPEDRFGLPSFKKVLLHVSKVYKENKTQLVGITSQILKSIKQEKTNEVKQLKIDTLKEGCIRILNQLDHINGGFGTAPKFPNTTALQFLLIISAENNDKENLEAVKLTLRKMAEGGIYDQIGGGFHRYSTDTEWKIPHFEKLLVDNALLLELYLLAYKLSKDSSIKRIAIEIINSIKQEFYDKEGFFYSSQDADVDNEEGLYFTWTKAEIEKVLNNEEAKIVSWHYGIDDIGEIDALKDKAKIRDRNVLYIENTTSAIADVLAKSEKEIANIIENAKKKLIRERGKRKKPFIDKTLYTNWNALMINSFLSAYKILGDKNYKDVALKVLNFIIEKLYINGRLYHMFADNSYSVNGFLDDYHFLIQALINDH
ncbi:MAG: thioredoxin domain-containing protein [Nanoarchaeota archaeon]